MSTLYVAPRFEPFIIAEDVEDYITPDIKFDMNGLGKRLFRISKRAVLDFLGFFYGEIEDAIGIEDIQGREMVDDTLKKAALDLLVKVLFPETGKSYHVEMETEYNKSIHLRMYDYGYRVAIDFFSYDLHPLMLNFPKSILIILEENRNAPSDLELFINYNYDIPSCFVTPVFLLWAYSPEDLVEKNLYLLLPFKVFSFRKELNSINQSQARATEKHRRWAQCRENLLEEIERISKALKRVFDEGKMTVEELGSMYAIMGDIVLRLTKKYPKIKDMKEEVIMMRDTWYDPALVEKSKIEEIKESIGSLLSLKEDFKNFVYEVEERLSREDNLVLLRDWNMKAAQSTSAKSFLQKTSPDKVIELKETWYSSIEERARAESRLEEIKRSITSLLSIKPGYDNCMQIVEEALLQEEDLTLLRDWLIKAGQAESALSFLKEIRALGP